MTTERLTTSESLTLDVVRVCASVMVAYAHLSQGYFSTGWVDQTPYARKAVAIFFVLSGFVIRYVTTRRPSTIEHYAGDRASRIYSVAIPALLLTLFADTISRHVNPAFYAFWAQDYIHPLVRLLKNMLFLGNFWSHTVPPFSDSPYWSVNYEVAYYALYAAAFYLRARTRIFWLLVLGLLAGPRILYLAPLWIAGCVAHDLYQRWSKAGTAHTMVPAWLLLTIIVGAIIDRFPTVFTLSFYPKLQHMSQLAGIRPPDYLFGFLWTPLLLALLLLARTVHIHSESRLVKTVRFISEGTFPIYLTHFPLYVLIAACIPYDHARTTPNLIILASVVTVGILAGHPCNLLKDWLRTLPERIRGRPSSRRIRHTT